MEIAAAPFPASFQKHSDSDQPWPAFSMKMGKHEEPKDKQISSHCISLTAIYMFMEMKTKKTAPEQLSAWTIGTNHVIIAERIFSHE